MTISICVTKILILYIVFHGYANKSYRQNSTNPSGMGRGEKAAALITKCGSLSLSLCRIPALDVADRLAKRPPAGEALAAGSCDRLLGMRIDLFVPFLTVVHGKVYRDHVVVFAPGIVLHHFLLHFSAQMQRYMCGHTAVDIARLLQKGIKRPLTITDVQNNHCNFYKENVKN